MKKEDYIESLSPPGKPVSLPVSGGTALLVLDMQDYFILPESHAHVPSAIHLVPAINRLAGAFHALNLPVIFTRHINSTGNSGMMGVWWRDMITADNKLSMITSNLNLCGAQVIEKPQYDAFFTTGLEKLLLEKGVDTVVITGVMTHLCCETTARSAFVRGFRVIMPYDGTATLNRELHVASYLSLHHGFMDGSSIKSILRALHHD